MHTLNISALRKAALTLAVTLAFLFAIDSTVRAWNPVKAYYPWGHDHLQDKLDKLDAHYRKHGRIDVLTLGCSTSQGLGVGSWQEETNDSLVCFNLSVAGLYAINSEALLKHYIYPKYKPKHVIYIPHIRQIFDGYGANERQFVRQFWESPMGKYHFSDNAFDRSLAALNLSLYLTQTRQHLHTLLKNYDKRKQVLDATPITGVDEYGAYHCSAWRSASKYSAYAKPFMPHLSLAALARLGAWCTENKVVFWIVNQGQSPSAWNDFTKDGRVIYDSSMRSIIPSNRYVDVASLDIMRDEDFYDEYHVNITGQQHIDRYLFNHLVSPNFVKSGKGMDKTERFSLAQRNFMISGMSICKDWRFASEYQLRTCAAESSVVLMLEFEPGDYSCILYAFPENAPDKATPHRPTHPPPQVTLAAFDMAGTVVSRSNAALSQDLVLFGGFTRTCLQISIPEKSRLLLAMSGVSPDTRLILDSLAVRKMGTKLAEATQGESYAVDATMPIRVNLLDNPGFYTESFTTSPSVIAHGWNCYSPNATLLATANGRKQLKLVEPGPVMQWLEKHMYPSLKGKTLTLSHTQSGTETDGAVHLIAEFDSATSRIVQVAKRVNKPSGNDELRSYECTVQLPDQELTSLAVDIRRPNSAPQGESVVIDNIALVVAE